jgi:hypothetical protein
MYGSTLTSRNRRSRRTPSCSGDPTVCDPAVMPAITRHFHDIAVIIAWYGGLIAAASLVAAVIARKYGRTKRSRQAIYSVVGFVGLMIALTITIARLRGLKFTP